MTETKNRLFIGLMMLAALALATIGTAAAAEGKVNVNSASVDELALLPRVGATVAARIIEFRESNGSFEAAEDLMLVKGIGERTFELIEPYVSVSGETTLTEKVRSPRKASAENGDES
ncbi:MAG: ComEA family DNA-binding protein [Thermoanaerobaculia bacterium]